MLLGIVAKNSILLVDFAIEEMDHGIAKVDALIDAGRKRAQPIVMTTVAMVAGMVPTALSLSGDGAWRAPTRSEEHKSELQSLMRISYAVLCLKKKEERK